MPAKSAMSEAAERAMRSTLLTLSHRKSLGDLATRVPVTRPMVRRFIVGETFEEALPGIQRLHEIGLHTSVDILGESVTQEDQARASAARYPVVLDALAAAGLNRNVSLKPTAMGLGISKDLAKETIGSVFAKAAELDGFVRIDMEDHTTIDDTLEVWRAVRPAGAGDLDKADIGIVLQSAIKRAESDVEPVIAERGRVRLCKGAYKEPASVAYQDKADVDAAYVRLMIRLMTEGNYPGLATHDVKIIKKAVEVAKVEGVSRDRFEFQMLYGIRRDIQEQLVGAGYNVRTYVPFGSQWYPYFMRRLAERPANVAFIMRSLMRERGRD
jgi:proline dehydrogenase